MKETSKTLLAQLSEYLRTNNEHRTIMGAVVVVFHDRGHTVCTLGTTDYVTTVGALFDTMLELKTEKARAEAIDTLSSAIAMAEKIATGSTEQ